MVSTGPVFGNLGGVETEGEGFTVVADGRALLLLGEGGFVAVGLTVGAPGFAGGAAGPPAGTAGPPAGTITALSTAGTPAAGEAHEVNGVAAIAAKASAVQLSPTRNATGRVLRVERVLVVGTTMTQPLKTDKQWSNTQYATGGLPRPYLAAI